MELLCLWALNKCVCMKNWCQHLITYYPSQSWWHWNPGFRSCLCFSVHLLNFFSWYKNCHVGFYWAAHTQLSYTAFFTWLGKQQAPAKITRSSRSWKNSKVGFAFRVQVKSKVCWIALVAARISFGSWQGPLASKAVAPLSPRTAATPERSNLDQNRPSSQWGICQKDSLLSQRHHTAMGLKVSINKYGQLKFSCRNYC